MRLRIISKSHGIEQYDVTIRDWNNLVSRYQESNRSIDDLYLQEQIPINSEWETIAEFCSDDRVKDKYQKIN